MKTLSLDLHLHTNWSDGAFPPKEIAHLAKEAGLQGFAVTDHDTMGGVSEAEEEARRLGLFFVRGWEISAYEGTCKVHVLGYGCQKGEVYDAFLHRCREGGLARAERAIARANAVLGTSVTLSEAEHNRVHADAPLHIMHVVRAFAARLGRDEGELYSELFAFGHAAFVEGFRPTPNEAIAVIHALGGVAVLAHPGRIWTLSEEEAAEYASADGKRRGELKEISERRRDSLMVRLAETGLDGIECYYTAHTVGETERFCAFARERGLLVTGGSDFHALGGRPAVGSPCFHMEEDALCYLTGRV